MRPAAWMTTIAATLLLATVSGAGEPVSFDVVNASRPTRCAEEDNVYFKLLGSDIVRFRIEAVLPSYIDQVLTDSTAADFTHCDMRGDPGYTFPPRKVTLFEDANIRLVGHTFGRFWRPTVVRFTVGDRVEDGLHLVQLLHRRNGEPVEVLVLYPSDGYWRAKPLPPLHLPDTAYGSSFLIGPIEEEGRPVVDIREVAFEPETRTFRLTFRRGGSATVRLGAASSNGTVIDVSFDPAVDSDLPFAALRSMFVTPMIADVGRVWWYSDSAPEWRTKPILDLKRERATRIRFGRSQPSRHNTSAPDLIFGDLSSRAGTE